MKAIVYTEYGSPDVLQLKEVEKPVPKDNELLIRVHASTVSAAVIWMRKGQFPGSKLFTLLLRLMFGITKSRHPILGVEFSGTVEEVGKDVKLFRNGDELYEITTGLKNRAYADYVYALCGIINLFLIDIPKMKIWVVENWRVSAL